MVLETFGRVHGKPFALQSPLHEHVQAVHIDAVVRMLVSDDDGTQLFGGDVLLKMTERAVAAVHPDRGVTLPDEIAAACRAARSTVRPGTPEHSQLHDHCSTRSTSGPRKRAPR